MASLDEIREQVTTAFLARGKAMRAGVSYLRGVFFAGGALAVGVAQFITWRASESPSAAQVVGICGAVVVFAAAVYSIVFNDEDAGEQLALARVR